MSPIGPTPPPPPLPDHPRTEMVVRASYDVLQQAVRVVQGQTIICPPLDVECLWEKLTDVLEATANAVNPDSSVSSQLSALPATGFGNSYGSAFGNS